MPKLRYADDHMLFLGRKSGPKHFTSLAGECRLAVAEMMALLSRHPVELLRSLIAMPSVAQRGRLVACPVRTRSYRRLR
jgi:hypothetical protein